MDKKMHAAQQQLRKRPKHRPVKLLPALTTAFLVVLLLINCGSQEDTGSSPREAAVEEKTYRGTIVAVGDSLTAGYGVDEAKAYPARLEAKLATEGYHFEVINAGVSGETSSGTLSRINWVMSTLEPDIVILETGANDGLRGINPDVLRDNLDKLVETLKENDIQVILAGMHMLPNLGPDYTRKFAAVYPEIARKHEIVLIPFFLDGVAGERNLNQSDGIHPTAEGYLHIVDKIYPYVVEGIGSYLSQK